MVWSLLPLCLALVAPSTLAIPLYAYEPAAATTALPPEVVLDTGFFTGIREGVVNKFLGIPFARPPIGHLRFREPQPIGGYAGPYTATKFGPSCIQQTVKFPGSGAINAAINNVFGQIYHGIVESSEDCLTLNVMVPDGATIHSRLPVAVFLFGGGFQFGGSSLYDGGVLVSRSVSLKQPMIFVSVNYRVSFLGFPSGREVKDAGASNLGLYDQREALRWIQRYISNFGGDPKKVTLWGQSAGAMSTTFQMVANGGDTEGLFRAAFMQSGGPIPIGTIDDPLAQQGFDGIAEYCGCENASDRLECLRNTDIDAMQRAIDLSPQILSYTSVAMPFVPRVDGKFFMEPPMHAILNGRVADIPIITGSCLDEGTVFSFGMNNVTTDDQFMDWARSVFLLPASDQEMRYIAEDYPADPKLGSPYDSPNLYAITPQRKRIASFQGDLIFQAPRRFFLENVAYKQNAWAYLEREASKLPYVGSFHGADLINLFGVGLLQEYFLNFVNNMDPNLGVLDASHINWPKYKPGNGPKDPAKPRMLTMSNILFPALSITLDNYREDGMAMLSQISLRYH